MANRDFKNVSRFIANLSRNSYEACAQVLNVSFSITTEFEDSGNYGRTVFNTSTPDITLFNAEGKGYKFAINGEMNFQGVSSETLTLSFTNSVVETHLAPLDQGFNRRCSVLVNDTVVGEIDIHESVLETEFSIKDGDTLKLAFFCYTNK